MGKLMAEDRTNPKTLLGIKKLPLRLVPPTLDVYVAGVMVTGKSKYGELVDLDGYDGFNWRKHEVRLSVYLEAIWRHFIARLCGQKLDPESGLPHEAHMATDCAIILDAQDAGVLIDDLPPAGGIDIDAVIAKVMATIQARQPELDKLETMQRERKAKARESLPHADREA